MNWKGEILLESLQDPALLETLQVENVEEIQDDDGLWHVYHVVCEEKQIPSMGAFLKNGPWFIHFTNGNELAVIFKDAYFKFLETDQQALQKVKEYARKLHIPEEELQFTFN